MADLGGSWAVAATNTVKIGLDIAAMAAQGVATGMKIGEAITDYEQSIADINARVGETQAEAARRIAQTKVEGVAGLKELGKQAAYESGVVNVQAGMVASGTKAKLGASGVRAAGSPLLAAQQQTQLAQEAANRKTESGNFGVSYGGLKLGGNIADINAQASLATAEYSRRRAEAARKKKYLEDNTAAMILLASAGGASGLAEDFFQAAG